MVSHQEQTRHPQWRVFFFPAVNTTDGVLYAVRGCYVRGTGSVGGRAGARTPKSHH